MFALGHGLKVLAWVVVLLLAGCASLPATDTEARALLVGNWYGEYACSSGCKDRDRLRWTRTNAPDGTQTVHFRYYDQDRIRENVVRTGRWGYENGVYWLTCERYEVEGRLEACPEHRYDFVVESLDRDGMSYRSEKHAIRYAVRRVGDDFRLTD